MKTVSVIEPKLPVAPGRKKVAAYARVSMESERLHHSLSAQISYYSQLIQRNPAWEYAGVYADEGISGTGTEKRGEFQRMLADCEAGKIDIILTKSISRFARNTVDLLETVRRLKLLGVEVRFEKENINTLSGDGEVMLTLLASFAEEESRSISENVKWGTRKRFEKGLHNGRFLILGYRWDGDTLVVKSDEAAIVRRIYQNFLDGKSRLETARELNDAGLRSVKGNRFADSQIKQILTNITYTGNLLFQKEYTADPITKKSKKNKGELPKYYVEHTHEAIIDKATWDFVQAEIARHREMGCFANKSLHITAFTSKILCSECGKKYRRSGRRQGRENKVYYIWTCQTKSQKGASTCPSKNIPEEKLKEITAKVMGIDAFDEAAFLETVDVITVIGEETLEYHFCDGRTKTVKWKSTAKTDWWTDERRSEWGERHRGRDDNPNRRVNNDLTGFIKCGRCGANYRGQSHTYADGRKERTWNCSAPTGSCEKSSIKESQMKALIADVLGIDGFDAAAMDEKLDHASIIDHTVTFHFKDGHTASREYISKKIGHKHSDEHKAHMSEVMKSVWTDERRAEMSERMKKIRNEKKWPKQ